MASQCVDDPALLLRLQICSRVRVRLGAGAARRSRRSTRRAVIRTRGTGLIATRTPSGGIGASRRGAAAAGPGIRVRRCTGRSRRPVLFVALGTFSIGPRWLSCSLCAGRLGWFPGSGRLFLTRRRFGFAFLLAGPVLPCRLVRFGLARSLVGFVLAL